MRLIYGRHLRPVGADPATVAREMVERLDLPAIVAAPALDYLRGAVLMEFWTPRELRSRFPAPNPTNSVTP